jgi:hypothetical protein
LKSFHTDPAYAPAVADLKQELDRLRVQFDDTVDPPRMAFGNEPFAGEAKKP